MNFETIIDYLRGLQNISEWTLETSHEEALETFFSGRRLDMARSKAVTRNSLTVHVDSRSREGFHRGSAIVSLPPNLELDELADRVATAMFLVCGFLGTLNLVPIFILFNLFFDGFADPARQAIQTDITTPGNRQGAFVLTYLGHNLGYSVGPVIAGFLFYKASRWLFFGNALMGFLSVLLNITLIPETKPTKEQLEESLRSDRTDKAVEGTLLMVMRKQTGLLVFGLLISLYGLAYGQTLFSLPLSAVAVFGEEQGAGVFGKLMSLNALLVIFLNAPVLSVTRRFRTLANDLGSGSFGWLPAPLPPEGFWVLDFSIGKGQRTTAAQRSPLTCTFYHL